MPSNNFLTISDLSFTINGKHILSDISLNLHAGEIASLLGPSGCGKTSLLRLIAGFSHPDSGNIVLNGTTISSPEHVISPEERGIGMVFQDYALFPHLSVLDNIIFGLKKTSQCDARAKAKELLELVGLPGYEKRTPHQLSGGEQQRVAIARALAPQPQLLLLDEPFASLDANLRERLVRDMGSLLKKLNIAALLVTHDQHEAFAVSEYIGMMSAGTILQWDTPFNLYYTPKTEGIARFVGQGLSLQADVVDDTTLNTKWGTIPHKTGAAIGSKISILLRPDDIVIDENSDYTATVQRKFFRGSRTLYELTRDDTSFVIQASSHLNYKTGEVLGFAIRPQRLISFM